MVFVTGGTGLVGCNLLLALAKEHAHIKAFKRSTSTTIAVEEFFQRYGFPELFQRIEWIEGDLMDMHFIADQLKGIDTIYHTAAYVSFDERDKKNIYTTNSLITELLVNEAIAQQIPRFVFISSIATMDDVNLQTKMIDERSSWNPSYSHTTYAASKFRAEMEVWRASQEGVNIVIVNPGVIIGSLNGQRASEALFDASAIHNRYTPPGGTGFIDVRDVVAIVMELVKRKAFNQKYILVGENLPYKEVLNQVGALNNRSTTAVSTKTLRFIYYLSQISRLFRGPSMSLANYKSLTSNTAYDHSKVKTLIDYSFTPIKESIAYHYHQYTEQISRK